MNRFNILLLLIAVWLAVFFESTFGGFRRWLGGQLDFLPALVVYASLTAGLPVIIAIAVAGGLLFDSLSANAFGVTVLPLFLAGFFIYVKRDLVLREQIYAQMTLGAAASAFVPVLTFLILSNLARQETASSWRDDSAPAVPLAGWESLWQWSLMALAGALATPVCFKIFDSCHRLFNYQPLAESSFRPDREIKRSRY